MPTVNSANLVINQAITADAPDTELTIEIDPNRPLAIGVHLFQLVVEDNSANRSQPVQVRVIVRDATAPTAVASGPGTVAFGERFIITGRESSDAPPGRIQRYIWTMLS